MIAGPAAWVRRRVRAGHDDRCGIGTGSRAHSHVHTHSLSFHCCSAHTAAPRTAARHARSQGSAAMPAHRRKRSAWSARPRMRLADRRRRRRRRRRRLWAQIATCSDGDGTEGGRMQEGFGCFVMPAGVAKAAAFALCFQQPSCQVTAFALIFLLPSWTRHWARHCLCLVLPLPSRL